MLHNMIVLSCVSFIIFLTGSSHALIVTSEGTGTGVMCGDKMCAPEASCSIDNTCVCDTAPFDAGNGYLKCFSSDDFGAFVVSDPILITYSNEHANLDIPCRYDMTFLSTVLYSDDNVKEGGCVMNVRAFNSKDKGKFYVHGVDTALRITYNNGTVFKISVRKFGTAENGSYTYQINATEGMDNPDGPFLDDEVSYYDSRTGLTIDCKIDYDNNIIVINASHCGLAVYFRGNDLVLRKNQPQTPGLAIVIDNDYDPAFYDSYQSIGLIPPGAGTPISIDSLTPQVSNTVNILFRALGSDLLQNDPNQNLICSSFNPLFHIMNETQIVNAFNMCLWILQSPRFIRCYDTSDDGVPIMHLFIECCQIQAGFMTCDGVIYLVNATNCQTHDPGNTQLQSFINSELC